MGLDAITYALSKKYTEDTVIGLGALVGAPCTIDSITQDTNKNNLVNFKWTGTDGTTKTQQMTVPAGVSITGFTTIDDTHIVWNLSDGTQTAQMTIPEQNIAISADSGNAIVKKSDGLYVSTTGVDISADTGNQIINKVDGLYVGHDADKVDVDQNVANAGKALIVGADGMVTVGDAGVKVSTKAGNDIEEITTAGEEGIYVDVPVKEVQINGSSLTPDTNGTVNILIDDDPSNILKNNAATGTYTGGLYVEATPINISKSASNSLTTLTGQADPNDNGLFVRISADSDNDLSMKTDAGNEGLFVDVPVKEIKLGGTALVPDTTGSVDIEIDTTTPKNIITTTTFGLYATVKVDPDTNNIIQEKADGLFVAATPIKVSSKSDNKLVAKPESDAPEDGLYVAPDTLEADNLTYDVLFDATATESNPYHGDADKQVNSDYLYAQFQIVIPTIMEKIKDVFDLASNIEYATYDTYAALSVVDQTAITDKIMIYLVKQDENYVRDDGAAPYYSTIYLMIPKTDPTQNAIEFVAKLNMSEKLLEYAITEAIKRAIYIPIPEHYELSTSGTTGALEVIADSDPIVGDQIHITSVTPVLPAGTVVQIGDYVVHKDQEHSTVTKFVKRDEIEVATVAKFAEDAGGNLQYNGSSLAVANTEYIAKADYDALPATKLTDNKEYWIN